MAAQNNKPAQDAGDGEEIDEATARTQRVLLITVIVLGVLLIIGFAIVVATIASRISSSGEDSVAAPEPAVVVSSGAAGGGAEFEVPVPQGYEIRSVTGDERRLVVHLARDGQPERILVINTRSGEVLRRLVLTPEVP